MEQLDLLANARLVALNSVNRRYDAAFTKSDDGRALAEQGMARTLEVEPEEWIENALAALRIFAAQPCWREFKMEAFRAWYVTTGGRNPHDHHVWGAFTNRAMKAGIIVFTGRYAPSVSPKTHGHPVKVWRAA
jgi:hypothetical protein